MKKTIFLTALAVALALACSVATAQMGDEDSGMMQAPENQQPVPCPHHSNQSIMNPGMPGDCNMGPGMMGEYGYGMGPEMMRRYGKDFGMREGYGPWSQNSCYGYGQPQGMPGYMSPEKCRKFLDDTKDLRRKLHDLRFEYREMMRDSKTKLDDKFKVENEILDLKQKIERKAEE